MIIRRCSTKGAFEIIPDSPNYVDFMKLRKNFKVSFEIPVLLIIEYEKYSITCYNNGKILIKNCSSEEEAEKVLGVLNKNV
ncbi:MAG TPA: hypothetical protein VJG30_01405 [Candidatus Nanoarchaeia archaeon]|nr:hypothetical protein [Candidatus Nanoarchaeia archaeon]